MSSVKELLRGDVIDGSGTANYIPKFIDTNTIGNSAIYESSGNIGIGTTSPVANLDIYGGSGQSAYASFRGNANTGLSFLVGQDSDGLPRLYTGDSRAISFWTSDTQRMRIEPSGSVLIGTTSTVFGERLTIAGYITSTDSSTVALMGSQGTNTIFGSYSDHPVLFRQNNVERMRITSAGEVLIGTTGIPNGTSVYGSGFIVGNAGRMILNFATSSTLAREHIQFFNPNGNVGTITTSASTTSYNTSSDYRLKENVVPMEGALDRIDALKPSRFNFIKDPSITVDGFLAHQVQEVVPEAIVGEKDAVEEYEVTPAVLDEEGNVIEEAVMGTRPIYQGIDQSKLVPLLTAAIQELKARIETLENK